MTSAAFQTWQSVRDEVLRRIQTREWKPGAAIPNEADLALELGCARSTVNRALRSLADSGLLERRRKAGTRVATQPVAKATLDIAVIRHEVESRGDKYGYQLIERVLKLPPVAVSGAMQTAASAELLFVSALHLANDKPYALEERWINTGLVATALDETFGAISANEWLLEHVPYTHGDIAFSASVASAEVARRMECAPQSALLTMDRLTWNHDASVTKVRVYFRPDHQLRTNL